MKNKTYTGEFDAKEKAPAGYDRKGFNDNQNIYTGSINQGQISFDYKPYMTVKQCKNKSCGSDYLKFSLNGFCQNCLQRLEYYKHERPQMFAKIVENLQGGVR